MTWAKVDDQFPFHRKSIAVGPLGRDLYIAGLCYAKRERTDGFVPAYVVKHLAPGNASPAILSKLIAAGYWHRVDGGFQIHDYLAHNDSAEVIAERDREKRARQRRWAEKLGAARFAALETRRKTRTRRVVRRHTETETQTEILTPL